MRKMSGGQLVVDVLRQEGVRKFFCVPGESYLGVLDALHNHPSIQLIVNRHEGGASFMAEAYAKASGEVGVCAGTRGPGAANLAIGIHTAYQDSTPLVALIGQVERPFAYRDAFQEVDLAAFFGHLCKWTVEIRDVRRISELLHRAFHIAKSGRPGPVVVALPHDMLEDWMEIEDEVAQRVSYVVSAVRPAFDAVERTLHHILDAKRPVVIAGGGVIRSGATACMARLVDRLQMPVVSAFRRFDVIPNDHPCYAGWLGFGPNQQLLDYIAEADLVVALGTRFSQVTTQEYTLLRPQSTLIHVDASESVLGQVYTPALGIVADVQLFLRDLETLAIEKSVHIDTRTETVAQLHRNYLAFSATSADYAEDYVDMDGLMHDFVQTVPEETVITSDAGNFFGWVGRYYRFCKPNTYVGPTSGAMGYGLPAAIAVKLAHPNTPVVSFSGDGGFMMTMQEMETATRYGISVVSIVVNNNLYGTIRAHQERHFKGRVVATELANPDYAGLAPMFGWHGEKVKNNRDFAPALTRALNAGKPALIEVLTNPAILSVSQPKQRV